MRFLSAFLCCAVALAASLVAAPAQTNATDASIALRAERLRQQCIDGRREICGRVLQKTSEGLVVDSGYTVLLHPPFNQSWVVRGAASLQSDPTGVETRQSDATAIGLVFLTDFPKRPPVKQYDYVVICGYPAGAQDYTPAPGVHKTLRRFAASLDRAVKLNLAAPAALAQP